MAVKIKVKRPPAPRFTVENYRWPEESKLLRQALLQAGAGGAVVLLLLLALPLRWTLAAAYLAWLAFVLLCYPRLAAGKHLAALRKRAASGPAQQDLAGMLAKQAAALGTAPPSLLLDPQAQVPYLLRGCMVMPAGVRSYLADAEVWAVLAGQLAHLQAGHGRLLGLVHCLGWEQSPLVRPVLLPLRALALLLERWQGAAVLTADRLALLLTRDRRVVGSAVLKQEIKLTEGETIAPADISDYLSSPGGLQAEEAAVTAHYRIGEYLRARPWLLARLKELSSYSVSSDYREALALLDRTAGHSDSG